MTDFGRYIPTPMLKSKKQLKKMIRQHIFTWELDSMISGENACYRYTAKQKRQIRHVALKSFNSLHLRNCGVNE